MDIEHCDMKCLLSLLTAVVVYDAVRKTTLANTLHTLWVLYCIEYSSISPTRHQTTYFGSSRF